MPATGTGRLCKSCQSAPGFEEYDYLCPNCYRSFMYEKRQQELNDIRKENEKSSRIITFILWLVAMFLLVLAMAFTHNYLGVDGWVVGVVGAISSGVIAYALLSNRGKS